MPKTSEMIPSNYLKQSDFADDTIVTVENVEQKDIAMEGKPAEYKWLVRFKEFDKPMVLNTTNIRAMEKACGSNDTDDWRGNKVIVYVDENVSYGGELVGGLRIKKNKPPTAPMAPKSRSQHTAAGSAQASDSQAFADQEIPD
jgi:hypothetical protein